MVNALIAHITNAHFTFTFMHLADAFIQSNLQLHSGYNFFFLSVHVFPGNRNPQPFALLTQCSTTEAQEHILKVQCVDLAVEVVKCYQNFCLSVALIQSVYFI